MFHEYVVFYSLVCTLQNIVYKSYSSVFICRHTYVQFHSNVMNYIKIYIKKLASTLFCTQQKMCSSLEKNITKRTLLE